MSPPPLFTSIPSEVLGLIASHFNQSTALFFSRLSERCAAAAEPYLWREIHLTAEAADKAVLQRKAKSLMKAATERRWDMVRAVTAVLARSSLHTLFHILDCTSHCITSLHIVQARPISPNVIDEFDLRLLYCGPELFFPHLTHIRLIHVIHMIEFIPHLLSIAPNLISLELVIDNDGVLSEGDESRLDPAFPEPFGRTNTLQCLRLLYRGRRYIHPYDYDGMYSSSEPIDARDSLYKLLHASPRLRQLSVDYELADAFSYEYNDDDDDVFLRKMGQLEELRELHWTRYWHHITDADLADGLPLLERLIVHFAWAAEDIRFYTQLPRSPSLQVALLECSGGACKDTPTPSFLPLTAAVSGLDPEFSQWLRECGQLRIVHFSAIIHNTDSLEVFSNLDDLEAPGVATGTIWSVRHGKDEILIVRLLIQDIYTPIDVVPNIAPGEEARMAWRRVLYVAGDESDDAETGMIHLDPIVQVFTDLDGLPVPLEILEKMRDVEGLSEEEWDRRGMEVGDEAWRVLLDWRAGL